MPQFIPLSVHIPTLQCYACAVLAKSDVELPVQLVSQIRGFSFVLAMVRAIGMQHDIEITSLDWLWYSRNIWSDEDHVHSRWQLPSSLIESIYDARILANLCGHVIKKSTGFSALLSRLLFFLSYRNRPDDVDMVLKVLRLPQLIEAASKEDLTPALCECWHPKIAAELIKLGANPSSTSHAPVGHLVALGHRDTVLYLLENGAEPTEYNGFTCLEWACMSGMTEVVPILIDAGDVVDRSVILATLSARHYDILRYLMPVIRDMASLHYDCIHKAARNGDAISLTILLKGAPKMPSYPSQSLVHAAAKSGSGDCVRLLLTQHYDATHVLSDGDKCTPLHCAGSKSVVDVLIEFGADVNARTNDARRDTPLQWAVRTCSPPVVLALLAHGADPKILSVSNTSALHYATRLDGETSTEIIEALIKYGADVNQHTNHGLTPLHWACMENNHEAVITLLEHGADVNVKSERNDTPLHFAVRAGSSAIVTTLLGYDAQPDCQDDDGACPLHLVRWEDWPHLSLLLLHEGARHDVRDGVGMYAYHAAALPPYKDVECNFIGENYLPEDIQYLMRGFGHSFLQSSVMDVNDLIIVEDDESVANAVANSNSQGLD